MYILGLTTLGDSAATLIKDGVIVAAAEEERFSRRKHHSGFPYQGRSAYQDRRYRAYRPLLEAMGLAAQSNASLKGRRYLARYV
jgi:predicted NodU family carbamoyl transferase